jgi:threonine/homoserine/homoserine lactone efflux protein
MNLLPSMAAFALACSISPGPVNIVALSAGARYGWRASMRHVTGATLGFTLLLIVVGLALRELLIVLPSMIAAVRWLGVAFLLYMAYRLATDNGNLGEDDAGRAPSMLYGATMQWLNPKAWLASLAGMGAYATGGDVHLVWQFVLVYFFLCYLSLACWAYGGAVMQRYLREPGRMLLMNRVLALLLVASAVYLIVCD